MVHGSSLIHARDSDSSGAATYVASKLGGGIAAAWGSTALCKPPASRLGCFYNRVVEGEHCHTAVARPKQDVMASEILPVECLSRAKSLVNQWRREQGPDEGMCIMT